MSEPFLAEIKIVAYNFAPKGWALCDGQILPINQNQALFSLLGTTFGGNGTTNFALPDLRSRAPVHFGNIVTLGQKGGLENVTLTAQQMPLHTHNLNVNAADAANSDAPAANTVMGKAGTDMFAAPGAQVAMSAAAVSSVGGNQPHTNMQPFLSLNFCIALAGIYPSRN